MDGQMRGVAAMFNCLLYLTTLIGRALMVQQVEQARQLAAFKIRRSRSKIDLNF